jgi:cell division protein ZapA (FtsZ GTPase activity inhibitor)
MFGVTVKRTIKIHIAGQPYLVRSDADEGYVQSLAEMVNSRVGALKGNRQIATQSDMVLAALQLADELYHERQVQARLRSQVRQRALRMLDYLGRIEAPSVGEPAASSPPRA